MKYLNLEERKRVEKMLREGCGMREMGRVLERSHSVVVDEVKRNGGRWGYGAERAHERFLQKQEAKGNRKILDRREEIKRYVIEKITQEQWSPEQIAGVLRLIYGDTVICHETIYQFIYSEEGKQLKLWSHLRHKRRPRRQERGMRKKREGWVIPKEKSIHKRGKKKFGDLESDSMIFSRQRHILSVQEESKSLKCILTKLLNKTAQETKYALIKAIEELGESIVHSITFDRGTENAKYAEIEEEYGISAHFCDGYCSWQKGQVENTNGLVRQYLPLHTNLEQMTDEQIYEIQEKLNNRPRKKLGFFTPNQAYEILSNGGRLRTGRLNA